MIVKCATGGADPAGRHGRAAMIFIESGVEGPDRYHCREHVSPAKEKISRRERKSATSRWTGCNRNGQAQSIPARPSGRVQHAA